MKKRDFSCDEEIITQLISWIEKKMEKKCKMIKL
jgi:hypothetical protein